jgi:hypothetical protein
LSISTASRTALTPPHMLHSLNTYSTVWMEAVPFS